MRYEWEVKTAPAAEPVSVAEVKAHLRVDHSNDDTELGYLIESARLELERMTGRAFVTQTRTLRLSRFPVNDRIYLPGDPVASITHVKFINDGGTQETWTASEYSLRQGAPSWLQLGWEYSWPTHRSTRDEVEIEYVCGVAVDSVDKRVEHAIKLRVQMDYAEQHDKEWERVKRSYDSLVDQLKIGEEFVAYG